MAKQTFTTGQVLTAAQMTALQANDYNWTVSAKTANYVLVAADAGTRITMSNAGATTITVNTALFTAGDTLTITNIGAGACTITAGTATVSTAGSLVLNQYDSGTLYFSSTSAAIWNGANPGDITGVTAGTGISGGGTSGTVTITNSMATEITAKGDLIAGTGSATFDNLPVGTNGQTLVADSTASTGLKWATPAAASSGLTLITRSTFSNVASVTIASVFSSTYKTYLVNIEHIHGETTSTQDLGFQLRYGTTNQATGCYSTAVYFATGTGTTVGNYGANNTSYFNLNKTLGNQDFAGSAASFTIGNVGQTDEYALYYGNGTDYNDQLTYVYGGQASVARTYTGIVFLPDSGNITGQISIYGLATA